MWEPVNVAEMVDELISLWDAKLERFGIGSKVYLEPTIPLIQGDAKLLHRALANLIANAVDAMPNGGELSIGLFHEKDLHRVRIEVSDTGSGIPEEIRGRIFREMVTTKPKGTGLGLMITHQIICALHRGEIWFETIPGQGTTFIIRLPIRRVRHLAAVAESTASALMQNIDDYLWDEEVDI
jgi:signal transduction histidine kinase